MLIRNHFTRGLIPGACLFAALFVSHATAESVNTPVERDEVSSYPSFADVIKAEAITRRETTRTPVRRCTWEQLPSRVHYYPHRHERHVTERRAERCRTTHESRVVEHIVGYNVTLRYNGETFSRRTNAHPGRRMPVSVEISPVRQ